MADDLELELAHYLDGRQSSRISFPGGSFEACEFVACSPDEVMDLLKLYPQPIRAQSAGAGVEYLPVPRQRGARAGG